MVEMPVFIKVTTDWAQGQISGLALRKTCVRTRIGLVTRSPGERITQDTNVDSGGLEGPKELHF